MAHFTDVYYAALPEVMGRRAIYPPERESYILQANHPTLMRQRYYVWLLLEYAVEQAFSKNLAQMQLYSTTRGVWKSPFGYFSLSHSHNAIAVAVSDMPVGVDIQQRIEKTTVANYALNTAEWSHFLSSQCPNELLTELWTKKECLFKTTDLPRFIPKDVDTAKTFTQTVWLDGLDGAYALSVSSPARIIQKINL